MKPGSVGLFVLVSGFFFIPWLPDVFGSKDGKLILSLKMLLTMKREIWRKDFSNMCSCNSCRCRCQCGRNSCRCRCGRNNGSQQDKLRTINSLKHENIGENFFSMSNFGMIQTDAMIQSVIFLYATQGRSL